MEKLTEKEVLSWLDYENKFALNFIGVKLQSGGCKEEIDDEQNFINYLKAKPYKEIKLYSRKSKKTEFEKRCIILEFYSIIKIFKYIEVKDKLKLFGLSAKKPILKLIH